MHEARQTGQPTGLKNKKIEPALLVVSADSLLVEKNCRKMKHNDPYQQLANNCASTDGGTSVLPKKVKKKLKSYHFTTRPDGGTRKSNMLR